MELELWAWTGSEQSWFLSFKTEVVRPDFCTICRTSIDEKVTDCDGPIIGFEPPRFSRTGGLKKKPKEDNNFDRFLISWKVHARALQVRAASLRKDVFDESI